MGEQQNQSFQLSFNPSLKVDFQGSRVSSDGGLILAREMDERLGFCDLIARHLTDSRRGKNTQLGLAIRSGRSGTRGLAVANSAPPSIAFGPVLGSGARWLQDGAGVHGTAAGIHVPHRNRPYFERLVRQ